METIDISIKQPIPKGFKFVRVGKPKAGELYMHPACSNVHKAGVDLDWENQCVIVEPDVFEAWVVLHDGNYYFYQSKQAAIQHSANLNGDCEIKHLQEVVSCK